MWFVAVTSACGLMVTIRPVLVQGITYLKLNVAMVFFLFLPIPFFISSSLSLYLSTPFLPSFIRLEADYVPVIDPDDGNLVSILGYLDVVHLLDQGNY